MAATAALLAFFAVAAMQGFGPLRATNAVAQEVDGQGQPAGEPIAAADEHADQEVDYHPVISPGHEDLLVDMLGKGVTLPGPCKLTGARVDHSMIVSTYGCPNGDVVYELHHPSVAPSGAVATEKFAISLNTGAPPEGLTDAIAERVRSKEGAFEWTWLGILRARTPTQTLTLIAAVALLVGGGTAWILLRRRT